MGRKDVTVSDLLSGFHDLNLGVKVASLFNSDVDNDSYESGLIF